MSSIASKIRWASSLARREMNERLRALTELANLRDSREDVRFFRKRWPDFFPSPLYDAAEQSLDTLEGRTFVRFREGVKGLWNGTHREPYLAVSMLDIHGGGLSYVIDNTYKIAEVHFGWDWTLGEFVYASNMKFHQALFLLLGRRRLAKVCPHCQQCFLAKRGTQLYCSTDCSEIAERNWKRDWWRKYGEDWRRKRVAVQGKTNGHRNGRE